MSSLTLRLIAYGATATTFPAFVWLIVDVVRNPENTYKWWLVLYAVIIPLMLAGCVTAFGARIGIGAAYRFTVDEFSYPTSALRLAVRAGVGSVLVAHLMFLLAANYLGYPAFPFFYYLLATAYLFASSVGAALLSLDMHRFAPTVRDLRRSHLRPIGYGRVSTHLDSRFLAFGAVLIPLLVSLIPITASMIAGEAGSVAGLIYLAFPTIPFGILSGIGASWGIDQGRLYSALRPRLRRTKIVHAAFAGVGAAAAGTLPIGAFLFLMFLQPELIGIILFATAATLFVAFAIATGVLTLTSQRSAPGSARAGTSTPRRRARLPRKRSTR